MNTEPILLYIIVVIAIISYITYRELNIKCPKCNNKLSCHSEIQDKELVDYMECEPCKYKTFVNAEYIG